MSKFTSTSLNHIKSYSLVSKTVSYLSSFTLIVTLYNYASDILTKSLDYVSGYPRIFDGIKFVDLKFNQYILDTFDYIISIPIGYYNAITSKITGIWGKFNGIYLSKVDQYLPGGKVELKDSELSNTYAITNELVVRSKSSAVDSYNGLSSYLVNTYNTEYTKSTGSNEVVKRVSVGVNTLKTILEDLNSKFVDPFKTSTTNYVNDVAAQTKSKADSLISDAKQVISNKIDETPVPVSASA